MVKSAVEKLVPFDSILRLGDLAPQAPANLRNEIHLGLTLTTEGDALSELSLMMACQITRAARATVCGIREPLLEEICRQLNAWFSDSSFLFRLPLGPARTEFQERLRVALCAIKSGEVFSYAELARQLQSSPRAVGQALGSNTLPLIVPCHRIISAGKNRLTGFNHASEGPMLLLKAWLLARETRA